MAIKKKHSQRLPKNKYLSDEWEWPKEGGKWPKETRIAYIKELFKRGVLDPPRQKLAEQMGVSRRMLYMDFKEVYKRGIDPEEVNQTKVQIANSLKNALIEASDLIVSAGKDKKTKIAAIKTLGEITDRYTLFLERFDIKKPGQIEQVDSEIVIRWLEPDVKRVESEVKKKKKV